jgi:hypothetical protein
MARKQLPQMRQWKDGGLIMVARTLPFKLEHELPSIPPEQMEPQQSPA